jgi:hypothetical protein
VLDHFRPKARHTTVQRTRRETASLNLARVNLLGLTYYQTGEQQVIKYWLHAMGEKIGEGRETMWTLKRSPVVSVVLLFNIELVFDSR